MDSGRHDGEIEASPGVTSENESHPGERIVKSLAYTNNVLWQLYGVENCRRNWATLEQLSLFRCTSTEIICLPNLKKLMIWFDDERIWELPNIDFQTLVKLQMLCLSFYNKKSVAYLNQYRNLKVLKLGEPTRETQDDNTTVAQLFSADLPFRLQELILDHSVGNENYEKFLAVQIPSLKRLKVHDISFDNIAKIINESKIESLCIAYETSCVDSQMEQNDDKYFLLRDLLTKPNTSLKNLDMRLAYDTELVKVICEMAPNIETLDISALNDDWIDWMAVNMKNLKVMRSYDRDDVWYDDEGNVKSCKACKSKAAECETSDDGTEKVDDNPINYYKKLVESDAEGNVNKNVTFKMLGSFDKNSVDEFAIADVTYKKVIVLNPCNVS